MKILYILPLIAVMFLPCNVQATSFASIECLPQNDDSPIDQRRLEMAQEYINKEEYNLAIKLLNSVLENNPNSSKARELMETCRMKEKSAYNDACQSESKSALEGFLNKFPQSEYASSIRSRIDDFDLWTKAKNENTIESYNDYLRRSTSLAYKDEANIHIQTIKAEQDWAKCKDSNDEKMLSDFISAYPQSPNVNEAKYLLNIIRGEKYYKQGNEGFAYSYLKDANDYRTLSGQSAEIFRQLQEKNDMRLY